MAAAAGLVAAVAAALGALLMAPGLTQPHGEGSPEGSGAGPRGGAAAAERRPPGRMDQALLLVRNELPAQGLRLAARSGACHQVSGATRGGAVPGPCVCHPPPASAFDSPAPALGGAASLSWPLPPPLLRPFPSVLPSSGPAAGVAPLPGHLPLAFPLPLCKAGPPLTLLWH